MSQRDPYLVAYDITAPRRLQAARKLVRAYSAGGQKSVFECFLTPAECRHLLEALRGVIEPQDDKLILIRLDPRSRVRVLGTGDAAANPPFFYQG